MPLFFNHIYLNIWFLQGENINKIGDKAQILQSKNINNFLSQKNNNKILEIYRAITQQKIKDVYPKVHLFVSKVSPKFDEIPLMLLQNI